MAYDIAKDVWRDLGAARVSGAPLQARSSPRCCVDPITNALVVVGGYADGGRLLPWAGALAEGDARAPWAALPPPPLKPLAFAMAVLGERLYVAGGLDLDDFGSRRSSAALQVYDFRTRTWALGPPMPAARWSCGGGAFNGKFYVAGGLDEDCRDVRAVAVYDPVADAWAAGPSLPLSRWGHDVLAHAGRLVVFGGAGQHLDPLVLDAAGTAWVSDPSVPPLPDGFAFPRSMVCSLLA